MLADSEGVRQAACLMLKMTRVPLSRYGVRSRGLLLQRGPGKEGARITALEADAGSRERAVDTIRAHLNRSYRSYGCAGAERFTPDRPEFRLHRH